MDTHPESCLALWSALSNCASSCCFCVGAFDLAESDFDLAVVDIVKEMERILYACENRRIESIELSRLKGRARQGNKSQVSLKQQTIQREGKINQWMRFNRGLKYFASLPLVWCVNLLVSSSAVPTELKG